MDDIELMADLALAAYRFSTAWSRIFPSGGGRLNAAGLDFYDSLVDALLSHGITPALTLYHWDLPQALQERGGWLNRDTVEYFRDYAAVVIEKLCDRVPLWITHNEPWVVSFLGYEIGIHAPGIRDLSQALQVSHNLLLSHAKTVGIFREVAGADSQIGITLNLDPFYPDPEGDPAEIEEIVRIADGYWNRWFLDPVFFGRYPSDMLELYRERGAAPDIQPEDTSLLTDTRIDFLGLNYYTRKVVRASRNRERLFEIVEPSEAVSTEMGWELFPEGLHKILVRLDRDYGHPPIYITENGAAFKDEVIEDGTIGDEDRIAYLRSHLIEAHRAIEDGVDLRGYFLWSLLDNFEWAHGYTKRFGIVHVDYRTQSRSPKKSARWYRRVVEENGLS
jgi:beta-glucosidase